MLTKYKPVAKMQKALTKEKLGAATKGAVTVAKRVSDEMGVELGQQVGYVTHTHTRTHHLSKLRGTHPCTVYWFTVSSMNYFVLFLYYL